MENVTKEVEQSLLKRNEVKTKLETSEIRNNCLTHKLNTSNSQTEALKKSPEQNTTNFQIDEQQNGVVLQSLHERIQ